MNIYIVACCDCSIIIKVNNMVLVMSLYISDVTSITTY